HAVLQCEDVDTAEGGVVVEAFGKGGDEFAFRRNIRRAFEFLLDAEGDRHFASVDLQARELRVSLVDPDEQRLVAGSETIGFTSQGIVVRDLESHAGVARDETEHRETSDKGENQNGVHGVVRNMNTAEPAA